MKKQLTVYLQKDWPNSFSKGSHWNNVSGGLRFPSKAAVNKQHIKDNRLNPELWVKVKISIEEIKD